MVKTNNKQLDATILMAVYKNDKPALFEKAFESIFLNTRIPNEIILVIDGPINSELEYIIAKFKKKLELKIIRNIENLGLDKSLNIGLNYVTNEIIFRCDSDDYNNNHRFEIQFKYLEKHPNIAVIGSQIDEYDDLGKYSGSRYVPLTSENIKKFSRFRNPMNHQTIAMRKSVVKAVGGYPVNTVYKEDYILWVRIIAQGYMLQNLTDSLVKVSAGDSLVKRRGGLRYAFGEYTVQKELIAAKISSLPLSIIVFVVKFSVYLIPSSILTFVYKKFLRSKA